MTINMHILNTHILKRPIISHLDKDIVWGAVIDTTTKAMKPQGERNAMKFRGMVMTDGVGVSVLKQNHDTKKGGSGRIKKETKELNEFQYIEDLGKKRIGS
ncbi:hypothetical protein BDF14DRAFT_1861931 [Spinellus fusiger]|nr:hypothetical protein BDF14DRAFT_1861931 [Spinellus fusiger]